MSTRSNVLLTFGKNRIYIYRHWDGYPAETGADLVTKLQASKDPEQFLRALLDARDEGTGYREPSPVYELTDNVHGDIDWAYVVSFDGDREIGAAERTYSRNETPEDVLSRAGVSLLSPASFIAFVVNPDRAEINKRVAELKQQHPTSVYKDAEPYPMLVV